MQIQTSHPKDIITLRAKDAIYKKLYTLKGNPTDIGVWLDNGYATVTMRPQSKEKGITFHTILQFGAELEDAGFTITAYWLGPKVRPGTYEGVDIEITEQELFETPEEPILTPDHAHTEPDLTGDVPEEEPQTLTE